MSKLLPTMLRTIAKIEASADVALKMPRTRLSLSTAAHVLVSARFMDLLRKVDMTKRTTWNVKQVIMMATSNTIKRQPALTEKL